MRTVPELAERVKHSEDQREEKEAKRQRVEVSSPTGEIPETIALNASGGPDGAGSYADCDPPCCT